MNAALFCTLLCVFFVSCAASRSRSRSRSRIGYKQYHGGYRPNTYQKNYPSHRPKRIPGLSSDGRPCPVPDGCIQLPDQDDLMTRATFQNQVVGIRDYVMYRIEHTPFGQFSRQEDVYYVEGNSLFLDLKARVSEEACQDVKRLYAANFTSNTHVISQNRDLQFVGLSELQNPTFFMMSDNPSEYRILFTCLQTSTIRNRFCEGGYTVEIALLQDPPNNPPFKQIEEELCRKLGLSMDDPLNKLVYIGEDCPDT